MTAVVTIPHLDKSDGSITFERWQDCQPILEHNARLRTMSQKSDWLRHRACIPNVIWEKWMNDDGVNLFRLPIHELDKYLERKLRDPDWQKLAVDGPQSFWGWEKKVPILGKKPAHVA